MGGERKKLLLYYTNTLFQKLQRLIWAKVESLKGNISWKRKPNN